MATEIDWSPGMVTAPWDEETREGLVAIRGLYVYFRYLDSETVCVFGVNVVEVQMTEDAAERVWTGKRSGEDVTRAVMDYLNYIGEPVPMTREEVADALEKVEPSERRLVYTALRVLASNGEIESFRPWGDKSKTYMYGLEGAEEQWQKDQAEKRAAKGRNRARKEG